jgi:hypothetical protein
MLLLFSLTSAGCLRDVIGMDNGVGPKDFVSA